MNYAKGIEPLSALKSNPEELLRTARESGRPILLTQEGRPAAVLQDAEAYQRQRDTLALLKLAVQGDRDYQNGNTMSHEEADNYFRRKLEALGSRD